MRPTLFVESLHAGLLALADDVAAEKMRAYLRHQFTFIGVKTPARRQLVATLDVLPLEIDGLLECVDLLWDCPHRECQYVAIDLLARHASVLSMASIPALLTLAQRKPWWETVDGLAPVIGGILKREGRTQCEPRCEPQTAMDAAISHPSMWVRRIAMTHQLGWRMQVDTKRLFAYALALAHEDEFFIRKAIGWALRDYARWNPEAVRAFVMANAERFSALTVREALKHNPGASAIAAPRAAGL